MITLTKTSDDEEYIGSEIEAVDPDTNETIGYEPMVGMCVLLKYKDMFPILARNIHRTSPVKYIISKNTSYCRFETINSVYELKIERE